jgi:hypothetical protein
MWPAACPSLPLSKEKLDQTPTACDLLRREREGRWRGKVEQLKSWKKREPRACWKQPAEEEEQKTET